MGATEVPQQQPGGEPVPPAVVALAEITEMLGLSRNRVQELTRRSDFPQHWVTLKVGKLWRYADVEDWATRTGRALHPLTPAVPRGTKSDG